MQERVIQYTCDRCSAVLVAKPITFKVRIGWCEGAVSQEADIKCIDLCRECAAVALQRICNLATDFAQAEVFVVVVAAKKQDPTS